MLLSVEPKIWVDLLPGVLLREANGSTALIVQVEINPFESEYWHVSCTGYSGKKIVYRVFLILMETKNIIQVSIDELVEKFVRVGIPFSKKSLFKSAIASLR